MVTRAESVRTDYGRAYTETLTIQAEFERLLRDNPTFYLDTMFAWERPRLCANPPEPEDAATVFYSDASKKVSTDHAWALPPTDPRAPGAGVDSGPVGRWPGVCGPTWTYPAAGAAVPGFTYQTARAEIVPPSPENPVVTLKVLARYGQSEAGLTSTYRAPAVSAFTVYSGSDLALSNVYTSSRRGYVSPIQGNIYSSGSMLLPTDATAKLAGASLFTERGLVGNAGDTSRVYSGSAAQLAAGNGALDIRTKVDAPRPFGALVSSASGLPGLACRTTTPGNTGGYTHQLCLAQGGTAVTGDGSAVTFPAKVAAWLVLPDRDALRVYTASTLRKPAGDCAIGCDLVELGKATLNPGSDPGSGGVWTFQGSFYYPATGVVAADADVYFSRCADALTSTSCGADTWTGAGVAGGGVVMDKSLTVIAGTPENPQDLWVQGPVAAGSPGARLGLVATGKLRIPYWSHPLGGKLVLDASLAALGLGNDAGSAISSYPELMSKATAGAARAWGSDLTVHGSLAAPSFPAPISGFNSVTVLANTNLNAAAPPSFPGFSAAAIRVTNQRQDSGSFCGEASCYGKW